ncbi:hypothetical protein [Streptomyces sp. NPDC007088]|uniref:hypothetical protein n=1 Tax=Streptomyces sp. NPDC007088 TaxID=3364773 RepID=UPI00368C8E19
MTASGAGVRRGRLLFDGWIAGVGTTSGTRLVLGHWPRSPFGPFSDVMVQDADGRRTLFAPSQRVAEFVAATYTFDRVRVVPVAVDVAGARWSVTAGPLRLWLTVGRRTPLGRLLCVVPARLARSRRWARLCDGPARLLPGVRTLGSAGAGRREWYGARDLHSLRSVRAELDGRDLGAPGPLSPPVTFGFGSAPRTPALVRVCSTVELPQEGKR